MGYRLFLLAFAAGIDTFLHPFAGLTNLVVYFNTVTGLPTILSIFLKFDKLEKRENYDLSPFSAFMFGFYFSFYVVFKINEKIQSNYRIGNQYIIELLTR